MMKKIQKLKIFLSSIVFRTGIGNQSPAARPFRAIIPLGRN